MVTAMAFENLRLTWKRAGVRAKAQSQGATAEQALLIADILYPLPGQPRPGIITFMPDGTMIRHDDQP